MRPRPNYAAVGAFMLGLTAVAIAVALWLTSGGVSLQHHDRYIARFEESVSGLSRGAQVTFRGVPVGTVREIAIEVADPDRVRLVLEVARGTPVTQDTVAVLAFQGLTGIATVDLAGGGRASPPLAPTPGEPYRVIRTAPSTMKRLETGATALVADLAETARSANALLGEQTRVALQQTVADTQRVVHALPGLVAQIGRDAEAVERLVQDVTRVSAATRAVVDEASGAAKDTRRAVRRLDGESLVELQRLLAEMTEAVAGLGRLSRDLERSRGALLGGQQPPPGPGE